MPVHRPALIKSFLVYKRTMAKIMANQQGALSNPKATCYPATMDIVDVEFAIVDVEGQLRDVASALATKSNIQSFLDLLFQLDLLSSFTPENRLKLLRTTFLDCRHCLLRILHWQRSQKRINYCLRDQEK